MKNNASHPPFFFALTASSPWLLLTTCLFLSNIPFYVAYFYIFWIVIY